jgi:hypothetical protein
VGVELTDGERDDDDEDGDGNDDSVSFLDVVGDVGKEGGRVKKEDLESSSSRSEG